MGISGKENHLSPDQEKNDSVHPARANGANEWVGDTRDGYYTTRPRQVQRRTFWRRGASEDPLDSGGTPLRAGGYWRSRPGWRRPVHSGPGQRQYSSYTQRGLGYSSGSTGTAVLHADVRGVSGGDEQGRRKERKEKKET